MIKRLLCILLLCSSLCSAQDYYMPRSPSHPTGPMNRYTAKDSLKRKNFFISFNAGVSIPLGDFGKKDTNNLFIIPTNSDSVNAKGFANIGFHFNAKGGVFLTPNIGLLAKIGYSYTTFDANTLNNIINGYYYYTIVGNYNILQVMGGGFANFPVSQNTSIWVEGMLGNITTGYPSISVSNGVYTIDISPSTANDLAYSFSFGLEQVINPTLSFMANLSYTGAEISYPTCDYTFIGYATNPITVHQIHPVTMSYGSIDISIGLMFHL